MFEPKATASHLDSTSRVGLAVDRRFLRTFSVPVGHVSRGQEQPLAHILQAKFVQRVVSSRMPAL